MLIHSAFDINDCAKSTTFKTFRYNFKCFRDFLQVLKLKEKIEAERGKDYPTESQKLIYAGKCHSNVLLFFNISVRLFYSHNLNHWDVLHSARNKSIR